MVRATLRQRVETLAAEQNVEQITHDIVESAIAESREVMQQTMTRAGHKQGGIEKDGNDDKSG